MKSSTRVWALCESVGKPKMTERFDGITVAEFMVAQAKWLMKVHMGSKIRVTLCRSGAELDAATQPGVRTTRDEFDDMEAILREIASQPQLPIESLDDDEPELLDFDELDDSEID